MYKRPHVAPTEKEEKPLNYRIDFEFINKTLSQCHENISEILKDGKVEEWEYRKVIKDLQLFEKVLIAFLDDDFKTAKNNLIKKFNGILEKINKVQAFDKEEKLQGYTDGANMKNQNQELLYFNHIQELFGELVRVATKASMYGGETGG